MCYGRTGDEISDSLTSDEGFKKVLSVTFYLKIESFINKKRVIFML